MPIRVYDRCLALSRASGNRSWLSNTVASLGYAFALQGRLTEARALLGEHWAQVKDGLAQVVLLSGEASIGKSRLVQVLKEQVFASLLSLPLSADYAPLAVSPEQQKQQTLQGLPTILLRIAVQQPVLFVMEDLHWVDPSTLELLSLLVDHDPTARILTLLICRPDFSPP
jgi:predicted ATPase